MTPRDRLIDLAGCLALAALWGLAYARRAIAARWPAVIRPDQTETPPC